jgi:[acyl-carrier-protein] S-malonyltransferase
VRDLFSQAGEILEMDIARLCFEGPEEMLVQTENVQPAVTVVNLACLTVLKLHEIYPTAAAGHSLGEYSALYAAGVLGLSDVLKLVRLRGVYMQEAADREPGSMAAIMDLPEEKIREICFASGAEVANINCADQIIITGPDEPVSRASVLCEEAGAKKCIRLNVSGPWHSSCMLNARERFQPVINRCAFRDPQITVINNVDAAPLQSAAETPAKLVTQICSPVLWRQSVEKLIQSGYTHFVEVGPKKVLRGLMRRISRTVKIMNVEDAESLAAFLKANQE